MDGRHRLQVDQHAPALLLSPHFDDAVLSCWGLLSGGQPLYSTVVFSGSPSKEWSDSTRTGRDESDFMLDRINEAKFLYTIAGRQPSFLPFAPARYRSEEPEISELLDAIAETAPEVSAIYAPAGLCDHPDHLLLRELAVSLASQLPVFLYAEMPVACSRGWPALIVPSKGERNTAQIVADWRVRLGDVDGLDLAAPIVTALGFTGSVEKQRLAQTLSGQLSGEGPIDPHRAINVLLDPAVTRYEVCWAIDS